MNVKKVISQLQSQYPRKRILKNPENNPTEIVCEIESTSDHPEYSIIVAVLDKSNPHYHKKTVEDYKVIKGILTIFVGNEKIVLKPGESCTIPLNTVHYATGNETWFITTSKPGWTLEDHIFATS